MSAGDAENARGSVRRFVSQRLFVWLAHPLVGALEAVAVILTGLTGSLFALDLRAWFARLLGIQAREPKDAVEAAIGDGLGEDGIVAFWCLLGVAAALHVFRSLARQALERRAQERLDRSTAKVEDLVATNASPDYLRELGMSYEKARCLTQLALGDSEAQEQALAHTLQTIAKLAQVYDVKRSGRAPVTYAANVMWYIASKEAAAWDHLVQFRATGTTLQGVEGIVALAARFSATNDITPDPSAADFALDVPADRGSAEDKWSVLPGAPLAYARQDFEHFHPAKNIVEWFDQYGDFASSVKKNVGDYFAEHAEIAGFLSVPLYQPSTEFVEGERDIIGVLNVHWSDADILDNAQTARKFSDTIYPLRVLLAEQMRSILEAGNGAPAPAGSE